MWFEDRHAADAVPQRVWDQEGISWCGLEDEPNYISADGQQQLSRFDAHDPFHAELVEDEIPVAKFMSDGSESYDALLSPRKLLGAISFSYVYERGVKDAMTAKRDAALVAYHFNYGQSDWGSAWCPIPYAMVSASDRLL